MNRKHLLRHSAALFFFSVAAIASAKDEHKKKTIGGTCSENPTQHNYTIRTAKDGKTIEILNADGTLLLHLTEEQIAAMAKRVIENRTLQYDELKCLPPKDRELAGLIEKNLKNRHRIAFNADDGSGEANANQLEYQNTLKKLEAEGFTIKETGTGSAMRNAEPAELTVTFLSNKEGKIKAVGFFSSENFAEFTADDPKLKIKGDVSKQALLVSSGDARWDSESEALKGSLKLAGQNLSLTLDSGTYISRSKLFAANAVLESTESKEKMDLVFSPKE